MMARRVGLRMAVMPRWVTRVLENGSDTHDSDQSPELQVVVYSKHERSPDTIDGVARDLITGVYKLDRQWGSAGRSGDGG